MTVHYFGVLHPGEIRPGDTFAINISDVTCPACLGEIDSIRREIEAELEQDLLSLAIIAQYITPDPPVGMRVALAYGTGDLTSPEFGSAEWFKGVEEREF